MNNKIKPSAAFYLIPALVVVIGFIICMAIIFGNISKMVNSMIPYEVGTSKTFETNTPRTIFLMVDGNLAEKATITRISGNQVKVDFGNSQSVTVTVTAQSPSQTFEFITAEEDYEINESQAVLAIMLYSGNYTLSTTSVGNVEVKLSDFDFMGVVSGVLWGVLAVFVSILIAIISFIIIIVKRSKSKRFILAQQQQNVSGSSY